MSVAVIVPTYNNLKSLKNCLSALERQTFKDFFVYICVDGSTDGTTEFLYQTKFDFHFQIVQHVDYRNHGRNATRNLGLKESKEEFILFIDSDVIPTENWISSHLESLKNYKVSLGKVYYSNTQSAWVNYYNSRGYNRMDKDIEVASTSYVSTNVAFHRSIFQDCGLPNSSLKAYGADTEFALRLYFNGYPKIVFTSKAVVIGEEHKSLRLAIDQYKQFSSEIIPILKNNYPKSEFFFHQSKWKYFPTISQEQMNYWADAIETMRPNALTRMGIRFLLLQALIAAKRDTK